MVKFLIDECLSQDLVDVARDRGFTQSSHVVWLGKAGWKDWELKPFILEGDWTFVTRDSVDFRGPVKHPGTRGQYADVPIHAGLSHQWSGRNKLGTAMQTVLGCSG